MRTLIFAIVVVILAAGVAVPQHQHGGDAAQPQNSRHQHQASAVDMKAMDARLDQKMAAVDAAAGEARIDAMAAAIDELLSQRRQMREMITSMQPAASSHKMGRCGMSGHMAH